MKIRLKFDEVRPYQYVSSSFITSWTLPSWSFTTSLITCMTIQRFVLRVDANLIAIFPHYFIFAFKKFWRRRTFIVRRTSFSETTLSPGRELGLEALFDFELVSFVAVCFTYVGVQWIFFFLSLKIFFREVIFRFRRPLLLMAGVVGAAVAGSAGASTSTSTGAIYRGSMLDVWEGENEADSWIFSDAYRWLISVNIDPSSAQGSMRIGWVIKEVKMTFKNIQKPR